PVISMTRAKARQTYVLDQMQKHGLLPAREHDAALKTEVVLGPRPAPPVGPYYVEEIRRMLVARYGDTAVLTSGMRVETAMDPKLQALADTALREGLETLDRRMGYQGALGELDSKRFGQLRSLLEKRIADTGRRSQEGALLADLSRLALPKQTAPDDEGAE